MVSTFCGAKPVVSLTLELQDSGCCTASLSEEKFSLPQKENGDSSSEKNSMVCSFCTNSYRFTCSAPTSPFEQKAFFFSFSPPECRVEEPEGDFTGSLMVPQPLICDTKKYLFYDEPTEQQFDASLGYQLNFISVRNLLIAFPYLNDHLSQEFFGVKRWFASKCHQQAITEVNGEQLYLSQLIHGWICCKNPSVSDLESVLKSLVSKGQTELEPALLQVVCSSEEFVNMAKSLSMPIQREDLFSSSHYYYEQGAQITEHNSDFREGENSIWEEIDDLMDKLNIDVSNHDCQFKQLSNETVVQQKVILGSKLEQVEAEKKRSIKRVPKTKLRGKVWKIKSKRCHRLKLQKKRIHQQNVKLNRKVNDLQAENRMLKARLKLAEIG